MSSRFRRTRARLAEDVASRRYCYGTQVYVSVGGVTLLDAAIGHDGLGRPFTTGRISALYCAAKPVLAVLIADLVADGRVTLDARIGDVVPALAEAPAGAACIGDLLRHTAGFHALRSVIAAAYPPTARHRLALSARPPDDWRTDGGAAYSEWLGWYLLKLVLEHVAGVPYRRQAETLLREVGVADDLHFGMEEPRFWSRRDAIGVNVDLTGSTPRPLLLERARSWAIEDDPSLSAYGTMRALGRFYEWVLATRERDGDGPSTRAAVLRRFTRPQRPPLHDEVMQRTCSWGYGFMTGLAAIGFGRHVGDAAFGHTGQVGTSVAFADPDRRLVAAVLYNGLIDPEEGMAKRRPAVVDAIYEDVAEIT